MATTVTTRTSPPTAVHPVESLPAPPASGDVAPDETLGALISRQAHTWGDRPYAEDARSDRVLTFASVETWRQRFVAAPFASESTVALVVADPLSCAAAVLGGVAAGLWVAPLDPSTPESGPSGLDALLARTGAHAVLADRRRVSGGPLDWYEFDALEAVQPGAVAPIDPRQAGGGIVLSSSGTTGTPKVMRLTQDRLLHTARGVVAHHGLSIDDRGFNSLPLFHINAEVVGLLSALVAGSCLALDDRFHRTDFWSLMAQRRITWINAVPAIIARLAELRPGEDVPPGIRFVRSASAPLPIAAADRFEAVTGIPVVETYGMTEAASQITAHPLGVTRRAGSAGIPIGVDLRVIREDENDAAPAVCAPTEVGQVEIRGPSVIERYEGGAHADRFRPDGWLRTGDLGWCDGDGFLYLVARSDDVINRGGEKIYPREIEEVISADPAVAGVAVIGRDDPELGQVPVAFVVLDGVVSPGEAEAASRTVARINAALERDLVRARRPAALFVLADLPRGATGKVRRRGLVEPGLTVLHSFAGV